MLALMGGKWVSSEGRSDPGITVGCAVSKPASMGSGLYGGESWILIFDFDGETRTMGRPLWGVLAPDPERMEDDEDDDNEDGVIIVLL